MKNYLFAASLLALAIGFAAPHHAQAATERCAPWPACGDHSGQAAVAPKVDAKALAYEPPPGSVDATKDAASASRLAPLAGATVGSKADFWGLVDSGKVDFNDYGRFGYKNAADMKADAGRVAGFIAARQEIIGKLANPKYDYRSEKYDRLGFASYEAFDRWASKTRSDIRSDLFGY